MPAQRFARPIIRLLPVILLAVPILLMLFFRQGVRGGELEDYYLNKCIEDPACYHYEPVPTIVYSQDNSCAKSDEGECVSLGGTCTSSASCDRSGSASCIDRKCNVTATTDQLLNSGAILSYLTNWYTTSDGAWEVRYYRNPLCDAGSSEARCFAYQIRAAAATPTDSPGQGGEGGGGGEYCGDGTCNGGETCSTCPKDCGFCAMCGVGLCGAGQTCQTCPVGCGLCTGDVTARAVYLEDASPTCDEVRAASSTNGLTFTHTPTRTSGWTETFPQSGTT
jgi:hypothetical protein